MKKIEGVCWLCGQTAALTQEHSPPRAVGNKGRAKLQQVKQISPLSGELEWFTSEVHADGIARRRLCQRCNSLAGRRFTNAYRDFVAAVAENLRAPGSVVVSGQRCLRLTGPVGFSFELDVYNPGLVLRQIIHNFVSINGPNFVEKNPWIKQFLLTSGPMELPPGTEVYVGAMKQGRTLFTGGFGSLLPGGNLCVMSELSHWPLSTYLAYNRLDETKLTRITHWAKSEKKDRVHVALRINQSCSIHPYDFRSPTELLLSTPPFAGGPSEHLKELQRQIAERFGETNEERVAIKLGAALQPSL